MNFILRHLVCALMMALVISCGRNEPLSQYVPKSPQEASLKSVLLVFENGVNTRDAGKIENIIHADASLMIGRERTILSKAVYSKILPKRLAENPPMTMGKPKMKVSGDQAEVKIYVTRGSYNGLMVFNMIWEDSKWYIKSWKY